MAVIKPLFFEDPLYVPSHCLYAKYYCGWSINYKILSAFKGLKSK